MRAFGLSVAALLLGAAVLSAPAGASGFKWGDHAFPYTFLFGNHIDTHQETALEKDGELRGFFYIVFLDRDGDGAVDTTEDGLPIAGHCTKPEHYPDCKVGWHISASPCIEEINGCTAMFLYHQHDHPVWLIGPRMRTVHEETFLGGSRVPIPQPGSPGHYHWLSESGSLAEIEALFGVDIEVPEECNVAMASQLTPGVICPGYFLEIRATDTFAFQHGGEAIPVRPGTDLRTHHNFVTSIPAEDADP